MELSYKNKKLEQSITDDKSLIKSYGTLAKKIKQRIGQLKAADNLSVIGKIPVIRLHPYKGDRLGEWSIDIQENWRICLEIDQDPLPTLDDGCVDLNKVTSIKILSVEDLIKAKITSMTDLKAKKLLLSTPGDTIQESINATGMSQAELAERLGRSVSKLNELIKGKAPITKETATKLEYVLGIPASFWLNLERQYQDEILEVEQMEYLEQCTEWIASFPLLNLKKLGILPETTQKTELAESLLKFFRVASPQQWTSIYADRSPTFKIDLRYTAEPEAISVWLRYGEIQAENLALEIFDKAKLRESINKIQALSYVHPDSWLDELQKICADSGVALVYTPCIAKASIQGATRWIKNNTLPLIQITDRQKDYNAFWFIFYHELAHILYHGKKEIFIDGLDSWVSDQEKEAQADAFASRMLLTEKERNELFHYSKFNKELIIHLSEKFQKHPGIIVAQVQRQNNDLYNDAGLNSLKTRVAFFTYATVII